MTLNKQSDVSIPSIYIMPHRDLRYLNKTVNSPSLTRSIRGRNKPALTESNHTVNHHEEDLIGFTYNTLPLPCAYLRLPWPIHSNYCRLDINEHLCHSKIVKRMFVERLSASPFVYIIRYCHNPRLLATLVQSKNISLHHNDDYIASMLIEYSQTRFPSSHLAGLGFHSESTTLMHNAAQNLCSFYFRIKISDLPFNRQQLNEDWTYRCSQIQPTVETIVIIFDFRFSDMVKTCKDHDTPSPTTTTWNPDWMRRIVHLTAQTQSILDSWLINNLQGRDIILIYLPPPSFSLMIDKAICSSNNTTKLNYKQEQKNKNLNKVSSAGAQTTNNYFPVYQTQAYDNIMQDPLSMERPVSCDLECRNDEIKGHQIAELFFKLKSLKATASLKDPCVEINGKSSRTSSNTTSFVSCNERSLSSSQAENVPFSTIANRKSLETKKEKLRRSTQQKIIIPSVLPSSTIIGNVKEEMHKTFRIDSASLQSFPSIRCYSATRTLMINKPPAIDGITLWNKNVEQPQKQFYVQQMHAPRLEGTTINNSNAITYWNHMGEREISNSKNVLLDQGSYIYPKDPGEYVYVSSQRRQRYQLPLCNACGFFERVQSSPSDNNDDDTSLLCNPSKQSVLNLLKTHKYIQRFASDIWQQFTNTKSSSIPNRTLFMSSNEFSASNTESLSSKSSS